MSISLQLERLAGGTVDQNANIIFDSATTLSGDISYDNATGVITLLEEGTYDFAWWVATQSSFSNIGASFSLISSQGDVVIGNSPIKTGEVIGFAIIEVLTPPVNIELGNSNNAAIYYSNTVPVKASLSVIRNEDTVEPVPVVDTDLCIMTTSLGNIETVITPGEGSGNNQAIGAIAFGGDLDTRELSTVAAYVIQEGAGTGFFQIAVLQDIATSAAEVVAVTNVVTSISGGLFVLPLTSSVNVMGGIIYYLAVWNQVNASQLGAKVAGINTVGDAPPINFRVQNLSAGFTIGETVSISDVSLQRTPWLAAMR